MGRLGACYPFYDGTSPSGSQTAGLMAMRSGMELGPAEGAALGEALGDMLP